MKIGILLLLMSKTDDIPVFTGILIAIYRYLVLGMPTLPSVITEF